MIWSLLADGVVLLHLAFVGFALLGGLFVLRWPRLGWIHLPAVVWGAWVELAGWICPLTPLENRLRILAGGTGYHGGFVEHYVVPALYPPELTRDLQMLFGGIVVVMNICIYAIVWHRHRRSRRRQGTGPNAPRSH